MTRMRFLGVILSMYKLINCAKIIPMIMKIRYSQKSLSGHNWCLLLKLPVDINPPPPTRFFLGETLPTITAYLLHVLLFQRNLTHQEGERVARIHSHAWTVRLLSSFSWLSRDSVRSEPIAFTSSTVLRRKPWNSFLLFFSSSTLHSLILLLSLWI